jgi:bacteriocin biosynthesis cyclodehydratase domain-containing protein
MDWNRTTEVYWRRRGYEPGDVRGRFASASLGLVNWTEAPLDPLRESLAGWGLTSVDGMGGDLTVVVVDSYRDKRLAGFEDEMRSRRTTWMLFKPTGVAFWVGPLLGEQAGCWSCLRRRLGLHDPLTVYLEHRMPATVPVRPPVAWTPASVIHACGFAAAEIATWMAGGPPSTLASRLYVHATEPGRENWHPVVHDPECGTCGQVSGERPSAPSIDVHLNCAGAF